MQEEALFEEVGITEFSVEFGDGGSGVGGAHEDDGLVSSRENAGLQD